MKGKDHRRRASSDEQVEGEGRREGTRGGKQTAQTGKNDKSHVVIGNLLD